MQKPQVHRNTRKVCGHRTEVEHSIIDIPKALYEAAISAFDPASCNEGHRFAGEINRLCNLFNTNVDRMQTATAYGWVYDAVSQGLESIFNALDVRIASRLLYLY